MSDMEKIIHQTIHSAIEVLQIEAQAILDLADSLDESFVLAVNTIKQNQGRTILTGMGKSGHIANKIASTLASTGTPSFFVHPGEAAHGDLGMILENDIVIAISNSGENDEIITLLPALKRKGIKIIAITARIESSLAKASDIILVNKIKKEACPLGLAPTTSTTVTLALGDALAVCLLKARHFTSHDFALSHPAGSLGKSLLIHVSDIMHTDSELPAMYPDSSLKEVIITMTEKGLGFTAIIDSERKLLGIFTDGDLRRLFQKERPFDDQSIKEVMTIHPKTISHQILASEALHIMEENKINNLLVTNDEHQLLGAIVMHDLLRAGIV